MSSQDDVCYDTSTRRSYHPFCYQVNTKTPAQRDAAGIIETMWRHWPKGRVCWLCEGRSEKVKFLARRARLDAGGYEILGRGMRGQYYGNDMPLFVVSLGGSEHRVRAWNAADAKTKGLKLNWW